MRNRGSRRHLPVLPLLLALAAAAPAGAQQRPARDASPRRPVGTSILSGHVLSADTGRPVPRARVSASLMPRTDAAATAVPAQDGSYSFATLTDHAGAFVLAELPDGEYTLTASKTAYLSMSYGARRPQRPGRRITLKPGQQVGDVALRLPRGGVLGGRVYDEGGEPIVRATVQALRQQFVQGEPRVTAVSSATTDDRGQFRIFGLAPGSYVVTASARMEAQDDRSPGNQATAQTYAPTYYPGVMSSAEAAAIPLGVQQEYGNVDFMLQAVPTARVSGTVVGDVGAGPGAMVTLVTDDPRGGSATTSYGGRVQDDGSFTVTGVPPGRYLAMARSAMSGAAARGGTGRGGDGRPPLVGMQPVSVAGQDVTGITIALSSGGTIAGWITMESATNQRADLSRIRLSTMPPVSLPYVGSEAARIQPDGSFTISNVVAGSHLLQLTNPPRGWSLKGIFVSGRDATEQPLDVRVGQTVSGVQVVLTDRVTSVAGTVVDAKSETVNDCYVILFPTDATSWRPRSRMIQGRLTDDAGAYRFTSVPAGDYYLAVAPEVEPGSWYDSALLGELSKTATRVSVEEGDAKTVPLKLASSPSTED